MLPQDHTVMVRQTSRWGQIFLLSLVGVGVTAITTAWVYRIDEVVTVSGRLIPQKGGVEVKSPLAEQLSKVYVKTGEKVKEGDRLISYDVNIAKVQANTLQQQLEIEQEKVKDQLRRNVQRQKTLSRNIDLSQNILERLIPLKEKGAISEIQILNQMNRLETEKDEMLQLQTIKEELINDSNSRQAQLRGELEKALHQLKNEHVKAPIGGTIFDLTPDNDNYVTRVAEPLMKIVPAGKLGGEVNIVKRDIGFIRKGQKVKVRVNSFPYTEYGEVDGVIENVGADALPPNNIIRDFHFPVNINLKNQTSRQKTEPTFHYNLE